MNFRPTPLKDAFVVRSELHEDQRGWFTRLRCSREFAENGLAETFVQTNLSFSARKGTFRGLHYQIPPSREGKLVRCLEGLIHDVIVDLRPDSPTFLEHHWVTLDSDSIEAIFVPPGFAHGFLTGKDRTRVLYEMSDYYAPELARGMRHDDPLLAIGTIEGIEHIHPRDAEYPDAHVGDFDVFRSS